MSILPPQGVWSEFLEALPALPLEKVRVWPHLEALAGTLHGFLGHFVPHLELLKVQEPRFVEVENHLHVLVSLPEAGGLYCITFLLERESWWVRHLENLHVPITEIPPLPCGGLPGLPPDDLHWMRNEGLVTREVELFGLLRELRGRDFSLQRFRDGAGYFITAKTWLPLLPPRIAFALYLCWEEEHLWGEKVVLEELDATRARIRFPAWRFLALWQRTAHLRHQISVEDYRELWEGRWHDRAAHAGWRLRVETDGNEAAFFLS